MKHHLRLLGLGLLVWAVVLIPWWVGLLIQEREWGYYGYSVLVTVARLYALGVVADIALKNRRRVL